MNARDVHRTLDLIGRKWAPDVLVELATGPRRFTDLQTVLRVAPNVLARTLHNLEKNALVTRDPVEIQCRRSAYALTPLGRSLLGPLEVLAAWNYHRETRPGT